MHVKCIAPTKLYSKMCSCVICSLHTAPTPLEKKGENTYYLQSTASQQAKQFTALMTRLHLRGDWQQLRIYNTEGNGNPSRDVSEECSDQGRIVPQL